MANEKHRPPKPKSYESHDERLYRWAAAIDREEKGEAHPPATASLARAALSTTEWARFHSSGTVLILSLVLAVVGIAISAALMKPLGDLGYFLPLFLVLGPLLIPQVVTSMVNSEAKRSWSQETIYAASMPFPIDGHFDLLHAPDVKGAVVRLKFAGSAPIRDSVSDAIASAARKSPSQQARKLLEASCDGVKLDGDEMEIHFTRPAKDRFNRGYHVWFHALCDDVLVGLHPSFPIAGLTVEQAE